MDPIGGTDEGNNLYFESVLETWRRNLRDVPSIRERRKRNAVALQKEW